MATVAVPTAPAWRGAIQAMGQTGGASLASGVLSLLASKIVAVVLGPAGVALLATLQQLRATALAGATLNGQAALVQGASGARASERRQYLRTAFCLMCAATAVCSLALALGGPAIARYAGLHAAYGGLVRWLAVPLVLSAAYIYITALLNALGEIGALAGLQLAAPAALLALAYPAARGVAGGSTFWFILLLAASTGAAAGASAMALWRHRVAIQDWFGGPGRWWNGAAARRFLAISASLAASSLFASWALVAVRARILRSEGLAAGGLFDAAWAISMNQATLVLASLQTYYLPVLARAAATEERAAHIARVLTIAAAAAAILIAALTALKPLVIAGLYSNAFSEAARYLRWTLMGDYLKITSWILSIPLIATAEMGWFLAADLAAYGTFVLGAAALARFVPAAEGAAIAFVAMYAVHLAFCGVCLRRRRLLRPGRCVVAVWCGGLALVAGVSAITWERL